MKPGLWVSIRTTASDSSFYQYYTEWFVNDKNDKSISRVIGESDKDMTFFSTCWKDDIEGLLKRLMMENGLKHLKLDFPVVTSPITSITLNRGMPTMKRCGSSSMRCTS